MKDRYLIFGLGNPGKEYVKTRHNIGFRAVDELAKSFGLTLSKTKCNCNYDVTHVQTKTVYLAQPQTYMNLSGRAVRALVDYLKVPHKNVVVIFDEVNMDTGALRLRFKGTGGGQNGAEDVIRCMGTSSRFVRLKVGIGKPLGRTDLAKHVLKNFTIEEEATLSKALAKVKDCVVHFVNEGIERTMNKYNQSEEAQEAQEKDQAFKKRKEQQEKERAERKRLWEAKKALEQQAQQGQPQAGGDPAVLNGATQDIGRQEKEVKGDKKKKDKKKKAASGSSGEKKEWIKATMT